MYLFICGWIDYLIVNIQNKKKKKEEEDTL